MATYLLIHIMYITTRHSTGDMRNAYKILFGKREGERPFRRIGANGSSTYNCRLNLESMDWMYLAQERDTVGLL
jgi:hypothetical protein